MTPSTDSEALLKPLVDKPRRLRELLAAGKAVPAPGAFNAICAKIVVDCGFPMVYISGAGLNNGVAGYPDIGMMTGSEMARESGYIARSVNVPAIADIDTGFGEAVNVYRTVQEYEREGLCGVHLEDQVFPKRCGHLGGKQVIPAEDMVLKIRAAVAARSNPDFLIIARTDAKAVNGYEDALNRARAYLDAGAEMIFPEALHTADEFERFAKDLRSTHPKALLLANMTEFGKTAMISLQEFDRFGYNVVIFPMTAFRLMMKAVQDGMRELFQEGSQAGMLDRMVSRQGLYQLIHYEAYESMDASLATGYCEAESAHH